MGIFTTERTVVTDETVREDYAHAWAADADDVDLRRHRFDAWLKEHDRKVMARVRWKARKAQKGTEE